MTMEFISIQYSETGQRVAIIYGILGRWPSDEHFPDGRFQCVYMEESEARAAENFGKILPKNFFKLRYSQWKALKKQMADIAGI